MDTAGDGDEKVSGRGPKNDARLWKKLTPDDLCGNPLRLQLTLQALGLSLGEIGPCNESYSACRPRNKIREDPFRARVRRRIGGRLLRRVLADEGGKGGSHHDGIVEPERLFGLNGFFGTSVRAAHHPPPLALALDRGPHDVRGNPRPAELGERGCRVGLVAAAGQEQGERQGR